MSPVISLRVARLVSGALAAAAGYLLGLRPWHLRWGATNEEIARRMPWDDRVKRPTYVTNRAITIDASPKQVWPWLTQMGELPRGGFYSYDWIERLMGMKVSSTWLILPEHQRPEVGQALDSAGNMLVKAFDPEHFLVLGPPGLLLLLDPGQFIMERRMLLGIKERAQRTRGQPVEAPAEAGPALRPAAPPPSAASRD